MPKAVITIEERAGEVDIRCEFIPALVPSDPTTPVVDLATDIVRFITDRIAANLATAEGGE